MKRKKSIKKNPPQPPRRISKKKKKLSETDHRRRIDNKLWKLNGDCIGHPNYLRIWRTRMRKKRMMRGGEILLNPQRKTLWYAVPHQQVTGEWS